MSDGGGGKKTEPKKDSEHYVLECPSCGAHFEVPKWFLISTERVCCPHCIRAFKAPKIPEHSFPGITNGYYGDNGSDDESGNGGWD